MIGGLDRPSDGLRAWRAALLATLAAVAAVESPVDTQVTLSRISGRVADESGSPIAGAVVRVHCESVLAGTLTSTTDRKGQFAILGLRRGLWTITVTATGFEPTEADLQVGSGANVSSMRVTLRKARKPPEGKLGPVNVEALQADLKKAEALVAEGRIDEALALYDELVETVPALTSIHRQIGDLCLRKKDRSRALAAYQRLLDTSPDDKEAAEAVAAVALELGLEAEAAGERDAAIRYLEQALAAAPEGARAAETRAALARLRKP